MEVRLRRAYHWICPRCGESQFVLPSPIKLCDEDFEKVARAYYHLEEWQELPDLSRFEVYRVPDHVTCESCHAEFGTEADVIDDADGEEGDDEL